MSIDLAEKLKAKLTDKYVVVDASVPELRRFADWTGKVKTVNMNCRALVQFDGPADIGWYDIDPAYLTVVDGPRPKPAKAEAKPAKAAAAPAKPAAATAPTGGKSPLELIRAQQAAKGAGEPAAGVAGGAKPSPLETVRAQQAAKAAPAAEASPSGGAKLSPIELIRRQQAAKQSAATPSAEPSPPVAAAPPAETPAPPAEAPPAPAPPVPATGPDGKPLSKIELIRRQGAARR
jgi:hypothetical protein